MSKLEILVCEDYSNAFEVITQMDGFEDVHIVAYPCMCEDKKYRTHTASLIEDLIKTSDDIVIVCSSYCDIVKLTPPDKPIKTMQTNHCFNHLVNEGFANYIIEKGGYIVSAGWLDNWKSHIKNQGFDRDTAKTFYKSFCTDLVHFDLGKKAQAELLLVELSDYLELPYTIIEADLDKVRYLVRSILYEWRLHKQLKEQGQANVHLQAQCAEYSAILDLITKISSFTNKRDTIEKIKEIFMTILGAQRFEYHSGDSVESIDSTDREECKEENYRLFKDENRFCIKIIHNDKSFGYISVGDFLFPQYIDKYLNFAVEIAQICGLVLSNIEQYERLEEAKEKYMHLGFHDSLTGLYNRAFLNDINITTGYGYAVFSFDIDNLKYVNDTHGHNEGDKLIRNVAEIIKKCFRESDTIVRMGGDEFISIVEGSDAQKAVAIKLRVIDEMALYNRRRESDYELSVSIGYAVCENNCEKLEDLVKKADALMYLEKRNKKRK